MVLFGSPNFGYCGGEAFVGLIPAASDYVADGGVGDSCVIHARPGNTRRRRSRYTVLIS